MPTLVADLQLVLIKQLLTDEHTDTGILSHPLLSLILASESAFESVTAAFVARHPPASQSTVRPPPRPARAPRASGAVHRDSSRIHEACGDLALERGPRGRAR